MQAKTTGNSEQGDEHEAVFARLLNNDGRIKEMDAILGDDPEIIPDGDHCLLRRRSSKFVPIFCMYTLRDIDFLDQLDHEGLNNVSHIIPSEIYSGFSNSFSCANVLNNGFLPTIVFFQASTFFRAPDYALDKEGYKFRRTAVDYHIPDLGSPGTLLKTAAIPLSA